MLLPTSELWNLRQPQGISFCLGWWPEGNPRLYKYSWQIWTPILNRLVSVKKSAQHSKVSKLTNHDKC